MLNPNMELLYSLIFSTELVWAKILGRKLLDNNGTSSIRMKHILSKKVFTCCFINFSLGVTVVIDLTLIFFLN
jgi:hypothetical protein